MFQEMQVSVTEKLFVVVHRGDDFHPVPLQSGDAMSRFTVSIKNVVNIVVCPPYPLRRLFKDTYGPYSMETFVDIIHSFTSTILSITSNTRRMFMRKVWLMKQSHEIIEKSLAMVVKTSKLVITVYSTSVGVIDAIKKGEVDKRMMKYVDISLETVHRVHKKICEIIARDIKFIKMLSPDLLTRFVKDASPWMISKIRCLPWIEPSVALLASPSYNHYWREFWVSLFIRHFKISGDICRLISEYMPMPLIGETFLDFFRRKFDPKTGTYFGKKVFKVIRLQSHQRNSLNYFFDEHWCDYHILF
jgi:hypothetical protein